jgi:hypothetical protein
MSATAGSEAADFEERRAAWRAKGAAHDRLVRPRMAIGVPILIILAGLLSALLGR